MLAAKWKGGAGATGKGEALRAGQIRSFRITRLDTAQKRIDVELAE
jgi:small subunit ribosomal protein S1